MLCCADVLDRLVLVLREGLQRAYRRTLLALTLCVWRVLVLYSSLIDWLT
jgi:hypothetical protein